MTTRLVLLIAFATACTINDRSADYACTAQSDCSSGRTCTNGLCVLGGGTGSNGCPTACTTCNVSAHTCSIVDANNVSCPAGWNCNVACTRQGSCKQIDCNNATTCTIACSGTESCKDVKCADGRCNVMCTGQASCETVDCRDSCSCDVTCGANACNARPQCPAQPCATTTGCTSVPPSCGGC